jgi:hypothetical protein
LHKFRTIGQAALQAGATPGNACGRGMPLSLPLVLICPGGSVEPGFPFAIFLPIDLPWLRATCPKAGSRS